MCKFDSQLSLIYIYIYTYIYIYIAQEYVKIGKIIQFTQLNLMRQIY